MALKKKIGIHDEFPLNDFELTKWFKNEYPKFPYLNFKINGRKPIQLKELESNLKKLNENISLFRQKEILLELWKNLLGTAIVFLKSNDSRELYYDDEDYGVEKLYKFFKEFSDFETLFYGADNYYRDHVSHMFKVYLLGEYLLSKSNLYDTIEVGDKKLEAQFKIRPEEKQAIWCILSLTHDLGYGIGKIPKINEKTRKMMHQFGSINVQEFSFTFPSQPLYNFIIEFISSDLIDIPVKKKKFTKAELADGENRKFLNHIQSKYFLKFSNSYEKYGHGIFSCILLMRNLVYFLESDFTKDSNKALNQINAHHFLIRQTILRSIASHDCDDIYYLKLRQFPFLLTIFDEIQDWDRPGLSDLFNKKPKKEVYLERLDESNIVSRIEYSYDDQSNPLKDNENKEIALHILNEFESKCIKFRKILRSALGGKDRDLILEFKIKDKITVPNRNYSILHKTPKDVKITINRKSYNWETFENYVKNQKKQSKK